MRNSKRVLAGVAAGALGAATLTLVSASPASAAQATTIAWDSSAITILLDGVNYNTPIGNALTVFDANGVAMDDSLSENNQREVRVTITDPGAAADDTAVVITGTSDAVTATYGNTQVASGALTDFAVEPNSAFPTWDALDDTVNNVGTYTVTAKLYNTTNGALLSTSTFALNAFAVASGTTPSGAVFINPEGDILDSLGQLQDDTSSNPFIVPLNAAGGPFLAANGSFGVSASGMSVSPAAAPCSQWGLLAPSVSGVCFTDFSSYTWSGSKTTGSWTAQFLGSSIGNLTVKLGDMGADEVDALSVTSTSNGGDGAGTYVVPLGTTPTDITAVAHLGQSGRYAWNAIGGTTPTGGVATMSEGVGTFTVKVSADQTTPIYICSQASDGSWGTAPCELTIEFAAPAPTLTLGTPLGKYGDAVNMPGSVTDQFGRALPGTWTVSMRAASTMGTCSGTVIATATADAAGAFSVTIPAAQSPTAPTSSKSWSFCASNGVASTTSTPGTAYYTSTGQVTSLALTSGVGEGDSANIAVMSTLPVPAVALIGCSTTEAVALANVTQSIVNAAGTCNTVTATIAPDVTGVLTAGDGVYLSTSSNPGVSLAQAKKSVLVGNGTSVYVFGTKAGVGKVTLTVGGSSVDYSMYWGTNSNNGRVTSILDAPTTMAPNEFKTMQAKVVDIFGNPVPGSKVTASVYGVMALQQYDPYTDKDGVADVLVVSLNYEGNARVAVTDDSIYTDTVFTGLPDAKATAYADILIKTGGGSTKSINIVGARTTVSGKPGVAVDGITTGFVSGATVKPWVKFPGQTEYTLGTARPVITGIGDFSWSRKTGKKTYVYFTSDDGVTVSNRIIIPAK